VFSVVEQVMFKYMLLNFENFEQNMSLPNSMQVLMQIRKSLLKNEHTLVRVFSL